MSDNKGKSIELFFVNGDPDGMLTATIPFQWTGHVLVTGRTQLKEALQREEAKRPGVYLLVGENEGEPLLYIGESDDIRRRIRDHDAKKDWWSTAIFITSSGEPLNKAHIRFLESSLVDKAKQVDKINLENGNSPTLSPLSEASVAHMEDFLQNIYLVLPALKFDFFTQNVRTNAKAKKDRNKRPVFILNTPRHNLTARAIIEDSHFVVEEGSLAREKWVGTASKRSSYGKLFDELVKQGVLEVHGKQRIFAKSYAFNSPSAAGAVVNGRPTAGPTAWKLEGTQKTYKEWEADELLREMSA
jgi:hypothetical protein